MASRPGVALTLHPIDPSKLAAGIAKPAAAFDVHLQGVADNEAVELSFWELDDPAHKDARADRQLGTVAGKAARSKIHVALATVIPNGPVPPPPKAEANKPAPVLVAFRFQASTSAPEHVYSFALAADKAHEHEGDAWRIVVRADNWALSSPTYAVAHVRREVGNTTATYASHDGNDLMFFNDGSTDETGSGGAFFEMLSALSKAKKFVFISDWSFHPLFRPSRLGAAQVANSSNSIGALLLKKAIAGVQVAIHTWDHTDLAAADGQNDDGDDVFDHLAGGKRPPNLQWRASSHDNNGMSHHQKFVVLDQPSADGRSTIRAFFGGLDLTKGRFDYGKHPILPDTTNAWPFRQEWHTLDYHPPKTTVDGQGRAHYTAGVGFTTNEWYNPEFGDDQTLPREPWHDIHGSLTGPTAWDFVREFVGRWGCDPTWNPTQGDNSKAAIEKVHAVFRSLFNSKSFVQQWEPHPGPFAAQVYRSILKSHWDHELPVDDVQNERVQGRHKELHWPLKGDHEHSIQDAYRQAIGQADRFIYIETQYFMGSGKQWGADGVGNDVPEQLVNRIKQRRADNVPFHVYIVMPMYPEGKPVSWPVQEQRWLEWKTMEWMINQLGKGWSEFLSFYFLANWTDVASTVWKTGKSTREELVRAHKRYMIYVHSKLMLVDDRYAIFGSANLNERSLAGNRDTEIVCGLWPRRGQESVCVEKLQGFRKDLWTEHLQGGLPAAWQDAGSEGCIKAVQKSALENYIAMRSLKRTGTEGHLCRLPLSVSKGKLKVDQVPRNNIPDDAQLLPDAPESDVNKATKMGWAWPSPGSYLIRKSGVAE